MPGKDHLVTLINRNLVKYNIDTNTWFYHDDDHVEIHFHADGMLALVRDCE